MSALEGSSFAVAAVAQTAWPHTYKHYAPPQRGNLCRNPRRTGCDTIARRRPMKSVPLNLCSALSISLLVAVNQSLAQTPQRDNRPRTASIGGRVTGGGAPAANALVMVTGVRPRTPGDSIRAEAQQRAILKIRTDGGGP